MFLWSGWVVDYHTFRFTVGAGAAVLATKVKFLLKAWNAFHILDKLTDDIVEIIKIMPMHARMIIKLIKLLASI